MSITIGHDYNITIGSVAHKQCYNVMLGASDIKDGNCNCVFGTGNKITGSGNIVFGKDITITGDDQIIIGRVDLIRLLKRVEELEEKVEHLWWMPGGPACQEAEFRFNSNMKKLYS